MTPFYSDDWLTILEGDCRTVMAEMEPESVQCVVTSPPYFGLRDYGIEPSVWGDWTGVLGLEPTVELYVAHMVEVFRGVRRVLRKDGTVWLNLGDSYGSGTIGRNDDETMPRPKGGHLVGSSSPGRQGSRPRPPGLKPKDRMMVPARVALALQADGWWLRDEIVWHKPNPMPSSVTDRTTPAHEMVYLLTKSARYFFDAEAIAERSIHAGEMVSLGAKSLSRGQATGMGRAASGNGNADEVTVTETRNKRSVWTIPTAPYPEAHFATFPPKLVEPMILAGTSERGCCPDCGAPWERETARTGGHVAGDLGEKLAAAPDTVLASASARMGRGAGWRKQEPVATATTGWRHTCKHTADPVPCVVLDIFGGSGTVGMVAQMHSRRAVLIDLNPDYLAQQMQRNAQSPLGLEVARAGVRHHVKECEAELRGQGYVCIHRINSATATVVLRLAKLHPCRPPRLSSSPRGGAEVISERLAALAESWELQMGDRHRPERRIDERKPPDLWLVNQRDDSLLFTAADAATYLDALPALEALVRAAEETVGYWDTPDSLRAALAELDKVLS